MPPVKKSRRNSNHLSDHPKSNNNLNTESSRPKLFQCKGFGDCHMVFTRSEHLARHTRKHTGEKPYQCIVPGCTRMFSRWDNMMQHTQTHRTNQHPNNSHQRKQQQHQEKIQQQNQEQHERQRHQAEQACQGGLMSPISLGSPEQPQWDDVADDDHDQVVQEIQQHNYQQEQPKIEKMDVVPKQRRLSVADLCNPIHLTLDEFEALEGFARFRETPLFYESLRDLANIAYIEPKPSSSTTPSFSSYNYV
ncbi:hypothetical protein BDC45DRAFT_524139 [Circinella umbellata]|nr:hypothetical protein BDC45DRAFT_524139 [Circinella umbellata]